MPAWKLLITMGTFPIANQTLFRFAGGRPPLLRHQLAQLKKRHVGRTEPAAIAAAGPAAEVGICANSPYRFAITYCPVISHCDVSVTIIDDSGARIGAVLVLTPSLASNRKTCWPAQCQPYLRRSCRRTPKRRYRYCVRHYGGTVSFSAIDRGSRAGKQLMQHQAWR